MTGVIVVSCDGRAEIEVGIEPDPEGEERRAGRCDEFRTSVTVDQYTNLERDGHQPKSGGRVQERR